MKIRHLFFAFSLLPALAPAPALQPASFKETARQVKPSVVNISTVKNIKAGAPFGLGNGEGTGNPYFDRFFGGRGGRGGEQIYKTRSLGSGVIIDSGAGYILTNNHVVEDADKITVKLSDKRELDAEIVGRDSKTDLAVLKVKQATALSAAPFGDSDQMEVGDWVLAIGSPFGLEQTVSHGIISARGRVIGQGPYDDFLQTDAPINPGNSGGPLVNLAGEVVGINTAITSNSGGSEGVGFAIPSNLARRIYKELIKSGKITRGWLGVSIQELDEPLARYFGLPESAKGAVIADVMEEGPARAAGAKNGDVILEFNGKKLDGVRDLQRMVADTPVGQGIVLKVWRDKAWKNLGIKIGNMAAFDVDQPQGASTEGPKVRLGLRVRNLAPEELGEGKQGRVVVEDVVSGSPAEEAGIRPGDRVLELDREAVRSAEDFSRLARKLKDGDSVVLRISRQGRSLYLTLRMAGQEKNVR
jgi:serine protease Do